MTLLWVVRGHHDASVESLLSLKERKKRFSGCRKGRHDASQPSRRDSLTLPWVVKGRHDGAGGKPYKSQREETRFSGHRKGRHDASQVSRR